MRNGVGFSKFSLDTNCTDDQNVSTLFYEHISDFCSLACCWLLASGAGHIPVAGRSNLEGDTV